MTRTNDRALTIKMPAAMYAQLRACADAEDRTVASLLRVLARDYLDGAAKRAARNHPGAPDER